MIFHHITKIVYLQRFGAKKQKILHKKVCLSKAPADTRYILAVKYKNPARTKKEGVRLLFLLYSENISVER